MLRLYRKKFAHLQREAERNATWLKASLRHLVPPGDENSSCLDAVAHMNDGTKHGEVAFLFSQFDLRMVSAFATVE